MVAQGPYFKISEAFKGHENTDYNWNLPSWYCLVDNSSLSACTSLITIDKARMYRNPGGQSLNSPVYKENRILQAILSQQISPKKLRSHLNNNACAKIRELKHRKDLWYVARLKKRLVYKEWLTIYDR